jgi:hypothetical protein
MNMSVVGSEVVIVEHKVSQAELLEQSILTSIKEATTPEEAQAVAQLEIGKPLEFNKTERHSFQEWLQLSRLKPIVRTEIPAKEELVSDEKRKKLDLIDKFIESNPKIKPVAKDAVVPSVEPIVEDTSFLMTETLARVYLEQKKYSKAIQAYEILILKYPEKSTFFANRISDIKILQQNNN